LRLFTSGTNLKYLIPALLLPIRLCLGVKADKKENIKYNNVSSGIETELMPGSGNKIQKQERQITGKLLILFPAEFT
jgi:hypothetical protein